MDDKTERKLIFIGDIIAVLFFLLLFIYLIKFPDNLIIRKILILFAIGGFCVDLYFTISYVIKL
jgi:hypothetical protein